MKKILIVLPFFLLLITVPFLLPSTRNYNVLLITIDTLRSDYVSCFNPHANLTPNIDKIAREGIIFTNAHTLIPITMPAHTAILTSQRPHEQDVFDNGQFLGPRSPLISEVFAKENYRTAAFVSLGVLRRFFGLNRGFQTYDDNFQKYHRWYRVASEMNDLAIPWIEQHKNEKFFAWIHYSDPHEPYITVDAPPDTAISINGKEATRVCLAKQEENTVKFVAPPGKTLIEFRSLTDGGVKGTFMDRIAVGPQLENVQFDFGNEWADFKYGAGVVGKMFRRGVATITISNHTKSPVSLAIVFEGRLQPNVENIKKNYAAEVQYVDKYVGILWQKLAQLGIRDRTIILLTADHGESLGEHARIGHLFPLTSQIIDVPLIIYYPNLGWKGKKVRRIVDHLDVAPTILDMVDRKVPAFMQGESLKQYITWSPLDWLRARKSHRNRAFAYTFAPNGKANMYALMENRLKLVEKHAGHEWKWEAYDLSMDPAESNNIALNDPSPLQKPPASILCSILQAYSLEAENAYAKRTGRTLSEEDRQMLQGLGYISPH